MAKWFACWLLLFCRWLWHLQSNGANLRFSTDLRWHSLLPGAWNVSGYTVLIKSGHVGECTRNHCSICLCTWIILLYRPLGVCCTKCVRWNRLSMQQIWSALFTKLLKAPLKWVLLSYNPLIIIIFASADSVSVFKRTCRCCCSDAGEIAWRTTEVSTTHFIRVIFSLHFKIIFTFSARQVMNLPFIQQMVSEFVVEKQDLLDSRHNPPNSSRQNGASQSQSSK